MNNRYFNNYTGFFSEFSTFLPSKSRALRKYTMYIHISLKKRKNRHKTHTRVRIVLNAESRRFDGETSESDKHRLFNYHRGRVAETFVYWTFSGNKDNH